MLRCLFTLADLECIPRFVLISAMPESNLLLVPKLMTAAVYRGTRDIRIESVPVPQIGSDELLVRVAVCGVCPTDIKKVHYGTVAPPRIFGHETAGTIVRVGRRVKGFQVGERVALHHHIPCMDCHACRHRVFAQCPGYKRTGITAGFEPAGGGFAEYVRVMSFVMPGVVKIPKNNSFEEGAMLEPVNTVVKGIVRLNLLAGDFVLVAGQGPIGLMFTKLLQLNGARVIATDLLESRLKLARQFGAWRTLNGNSGDLQENLSQISKGRGMDAAVVAVPSDAVVRQAQAAVRGGGQVLLFAHTKAGDKTEIDLSKVCADEKDLIGSYSSDVTLQKKVSKLVFTRKIDVRKLVTHRFDLKATAEAVELAANPTEKSLKVVVSQ